MFTSRSFGFACFFKYLIFFHAFLNILCVCVYVCVCVCVCVSYIDCVHDAQRQKFDMKFQHSLQLNVR